MMRGLVEMVLMLLSSWRRLVVFLSILSVTSSYTVDDLKTRCVPCRIGDRVIHPTNCTLFFYCNGRLEWQTSGCALNTYYNSKTVRCVAKNLSPPCPYDQGINHNKDLPLSQVPQCKAIVVPLTPKVNLTTDPVIAATTTPSSSGPDRSHTTTILAVLLGLTFFILIVIVVGIFLYKRRQNQRRPRNFYTRSLPDANSQKNGVTSAPAPTANAAYLSKSLLREESIVESEIYEVPSSGDANYAEIAERTSKAYYSEAALNPRPAIPTPRRGAAATLTDRSESFDNHIYAETTIAEYAVSQSEDEASPDAYTHPDTSKPSDDTYTHPDTSKPSDDTYTHPDTSKPCTDDHFYAQTEDAHMYTKPATLDVEEPYDYCDPVSANPTLSFRRDAEPLQGIPSYPPPESPPESPPYYVDPIPDIFPDNAPHQYHTLEPLLRKSS